MITWEKIDAIEGWFSYESFCVWRAFFDEQQKTAGDMLEIGVYRGRSASVMANYRKADEKIYLCDRGLDEAIVRTSIRSTGIEPANLVPLPYFSIDLPAKLDLRAMHHTVRWFHIDGEHSGPAVYRELEFANQVANPEAIVVVDDFFSTRYPANTTEVIRYIEKNPFHFRLLMVGFNKAYLCRPESLTRYMEFMASGMPASMRKYGWKATIYKTTGPWDMDAVGMHDFVIGAGILAGPDDDPHRWHMIQPRQVWTPWRHFREFCLKLVGRKTEVVMPPWREHGFRREPRD